MNTPTNIIDGRDSRGKRISVSVDRVLWSLLIAACDNDPTTARKALREAMQNGQIANTFQAKCWIYSRIVKPNLLAAMERTTSDPELI